MGSGKSIIVTLKKRFMNSVAFPSAEALIRVGMNPFDAQMMAHHADNARVAQLMDEDGSFEDFDWPAALKRPDMADILVQMREGSFEPDGDIVARFCSALNITPDELAGPKHPAPAMPGIVEAAVLYFEEMMVGDPEYDRVRAFLAGEVLKARAGWHAVIGPDRQSHGRMLEQVEKFWDSQGGRDVFDDTVSPIAAVRTRWDEAIALYLEFLHDRAHDAPLYSVPKNVPGFDRAFSRGIHQNEKFISDWFDCRTWSESPQAESFLRAEAGARHILSNFSLEQLKLKEPARPHTMREILRLPTPKVPR